MKIENIITLKHGSHLYGTNTENSDIDYKGIYLPSIEDLLLKRDKSHYTDNTSNHNQRNTKDDIDRQYFSLPYFLELAIKGESVAIDMLHAPESMIDEYDPNLKYIWDFLVKNREKFYTYKMFSYLGYAKNQASKYSEKGAKLDFIDKLQQSILNGVNTLKLTQNPTAKVKALENYFILENKYASIVNVNVEHAGLKDIAYYQILDKKITLQAPYRQLIELLESMKSKYGERSKLAKENNGADWKAIHHALRAMYQLKAIYEKGGFQYPLPEKDFLIDVKLGKYEQEEIMQLLEQLYDEIKILSQKAKENGMRKEVDREFFDNFLLKVYKKQFLNTFN